MNHLFQLRRIPAPKEIWASPHIPVSHRPFLTSRLPGLKGCTPCVGVNALGNRQIRFLTSGVEPRDPKLNSTPSQLKSSPLQSGSTLLARITRVLPSFQTSSESTAPSASNFRKIIALAKPERKPLAIAIILVRTYSRASLHRSRGFNGITVICLIKRVNVNPLHHWKTHRLFFIH